jgi:hypothetical protein
MLSFKKLIGLKEKQPVTKLMVAETATSTWNYHLRNVQEGQEKYSGGAENALCGKPLGWDTKIPLTAWGKKSHIPEMWCKTCKELADLK